MISIQFNSVNKRYTSRKSIIFEFLYHDICNHMFSVFIFRFRKWENFANVARDNGNTSGFITFSTDLSKTQYYDICLISIKSDCRFHYLV